MKGNDFQIDLSPVEPIVLDSNAGPGPEKLEKRPNRRPRFETINFPVLNPAITAGYDPSAKRRDCHIVIRVTDNTVSESMGYSSRKESLSSPSDYFQICEEVQSIHEKLGAGLTSYFHEYATSLHQLHVVVLRAQLNEQDIPVYVKCKRECEQGLLVSWVPNFSVEAIIHQAAAYLRAHSAGKEMGECLSFGLEGVQYVSGQFLYTSLPEGCDSTREFHRLQGESCVIATTTTLTPHLSL